MRKLSRRKFLSHVSTSLGGLGISFHLPALAAKGIFQNTKSLISQPNIILITIDDLNDWIEPLGGYPGVVTPHFTRLAKMGINFKNAYCAVPVCNGSRTSLLHGISGRRSGIYTNRQAWRTSSLLKSSTTFPGLLKKNGYKTLGAGKIFHNPQSWTFGNRSDWSDYRIRDIYAYDDLPGSKPLSGIPTRKGLDFGPAPSGFMFPDERLAKWTSNFIASQQSHPFLVASGLFSPHLPWVAPKKFFDLYPKDSIELPPGFRANDLDDIPAAAKKFFKQGDHRLITRKGKWEEAVRSYLACISFTDDNLGKILDGYENSPQRDQTYLIVTSGHGFQLGEKTAWRKFTLWERATHVPLFIAGPGIPANSVCNDNVSLLDLYNTITELCMGSPQGSSDGTSLVPYLTNPTLNQDRAVITSWQPGNDSVRFQNFRYIRYKDGSEELYDHANDPYEWTNLVSASGQVDANLVSMRSLLKSKLS